MNLIRIAVCLQFLAASGICRAAEPVPSEAYQKLWNDPSVSRRIEDGIRTNRMDEAVLKFAGADGQPVSNATTRIEQTRHTFLFGANIFMLGCYPTARENEAYAQAFAGLFNAATVPFYWRAYEPERGVYRFAADSPLLRRRPPPEAVLAFCEQHGITPHGHTLVWDNPTWSIPDWLPAGLDERAQQIELWVKTLGGRYGGRIHKWDALNEPWWAMRRTPRVPMPPGYEVSAFKLAERYFPPGTCFFLNEATQVWDAPETEAHCQLVQSYRQQGARIDGLGLQFHFFKLPLMDDAANGKAYPPPQLFAALDRIAQLGSPIHVSEITLPSNYTSHGGLQGQAVIARNLYRLWFSHPNVESITWWNVPDGAATAAESNLDSGLLHADLTPKPAYEALRELIHHDWKTRLSGTCNAQGMLAFRGFHGEYTVTAQAGTKTVKQTFQLKKGAPNEWIVKF